MEWKKLRKQKGEFFFKLWVYGTVGMIERTDMTLKEDGEMKYFVVSLIVGALVFFGLRRIFVKPVIDIMDKCESAITYLMMYLARSGRGYWQQEYYKAREELELRTEAVEKIRKVWYLNLTQILMFVRERKKYKEFVYELDRYEKNAIEAKKLYEEYGVQVR